MATWHGSDGWHIHDRLGQRKYVTAAEFARFVELASGYTPRRRALLFVLAYTGCRISEALALTPHQLDAERQTLTFRTLKRRRCCYRTVPVPGVLIELLCQVTPLDTAGGRYWSMHRTAAWRLVRSVMQLAGIAGPMACPRGLRHGFGTRAASKNIPLPLIQRWMGHARATTTAIYLDVVDDEERQLAARMWR
jgi:integrase